MKWHTSLQLEYNKAKYVLYLDQKASQADMTRIQNKLCKTHLGVAAVLLITYIYIERVSLDTQ